MGEVVFPREGHTNWLSSAKRSALKTYMQVASYYIRNIYLYTYIHTIAISLKGGHKLEGEWERVHGRV